MKKIFQNSSSRINKLNKRFSFFEHLNKQNIFNNFVNDELNIKKKSNYFFKFIAHLILVFLSIIQLSKLIFKRYYFFNYMIDRGGQIDFRSLPIQKIICKRHFMIFRSNNVYKSLFNIFSKKDYFYIESFVFFIRPLFKIHSLLKREKCYSLDYHSDGKARFFILKSLFKLTKINKMISIDDSRIISFFQEFHSDGVIKLLTYQHGKISRFHYGLFHKPNHPHLIWSNFFYEKFYYKFPKKFFHSIGVVRENGNAIKLNYKSKGVKNILILDEDRIPFNHYVDIIRLLNSLQCEVFFKVKPRVSVDLKVKRLSKFFPKLHIINNLNLEESIITNKISYVIGSHSSALFESILYKVIPIIYKPYFDYLHDYFSISFFNFVSSSRDLITLLNSDVNNFNNFKLNFFNTNFCYKILKVNGFVDCE